MDAESGSAFGVLYARLTDLQRNGSLRKKTLKWFRSNDKTYGSFLWCCQELGLRADIARPHILSRRATEIKEVLNQFKLEKDGEFNGDIQDIE